MLDSFYDIHQHIQPLTNVEEGRYEVSIAPNASLNVLESASQNDVAQLAAMSATTVKLPVNTANKKQRRLQRYSTAEESLVKLFRQCQAELSPSELQIRVLEQATTVLDTYAQDAREKLRRVLIDRNANPEICESLKYDLWLQENRRSLVDKETKTALQHLELLTNPDAYLQAGCSTTKEVRRYRNLLRFLGASHAHLPIRARKATSLFVERSPKRRTIERSSPMRCRATSTSRTSGHLRPLSLGRIRSPKYSDAEIQSLHSPAFDFHRRASLTSTHTSPASLSTELTTPSSLNTPISIPTFLPESPSIARPESSDEAGTATIYLNPFPASPMGLRFDDVEVPLPDYALDLFSRLDSTLPTSLTNIQYLHDLSDDPKRRNIPPSDVGHTHPSLKIPGRSPSKRQHQEMSPHQPTPNRHSLLTISEGVESGLRSTQFDQDAPPPLNSTVSLALPISTGNIKEGAIPKMKKRFSLLRLRRS